MNLKAQPILAAPNEQLESWGALLAGIGEEQT